MNWTEFFQMGGYAEFVWPAYAVSILALLMLGIISYRTLKRVEAQLSKLEKK